MQLTPATSQVPGPDVLGQIIGKHGFVRKKVE